ncbi:polysaccharide biosynthesis/export family protein [Parapedobacter tibetensis]|uniref:polysaccharide biosynthesis/export family protein n=1 Tax=Parapedobacter tibetensis TaxID=2972951 RepID=UPI00214DD380|nr:polysaccharide biosynthesis/export family protein [Parapedobacter tibetensis]
MLRKKINKKSNCIITCLFFLSCCFTACVSTKETVYFSDISPDSPRVKLPEYHEPIIQVDDILHITIQTLDGSSTAAINQFSGGTSDAGSQATPMSGAAPGGYLVDEEGQVTIPILGRLQVAGLTTSEVRRRITKDASRYFNDPTVQVRFSNFKITVIGEVAKPATYTVPNEKVTILDVLGMAGDLTIHGKRDNILLVRENNGEKEFIRFNLNSQDIFNSPYFYLKQNDVIYVEPGKGKIASTNAARTQAISIAATVVSILTLVISRLL